MRADTIDTINANRDALLAAYSGQRLTSADPAVAAAINGDDPPLRLAWLVEFDTYLVNNGDTKRAIETADSTARGIMRDRAIRF